MARVTQPDTVTLEVNRTELETLRVGLRHTITYGTTQEEDRAAPLLADLNDVQ